MRCIEIKLTKSLHSSTHKTDKMSRNNNHENSIRTKICNPLNTHIPNSHTLSLSLYVPSSFFPANDSPPFFAAVKQLTELCSTLKRSSTAIVRSRETELQYNRHARPTDSFPRPLFALLQKQPVDAAKASTTL